MWTNHPPSQDGFGPLAWAAAATSRIRLGVGVVPIAAYDPPAIAERVRETALPLDRLRLGVGTGAASLPLTRVCAALSELRTRLPVELVLAALGPRMCALAGREADAVLLNAVTPAYAQASAEIVARAAEAVGRPTPRVYALVSVAIGDEAAALQQRAAAFYQHIPAYAAHFQRQGVAAAEVLHTAASSAELLEHLRPWAGVVDELVLGLAMSPDRAEEALPLVAAAAHGFRSPPRTSNTPLPWYERSLGRKRSDPD